MKNQSEAHHPDPASSCPPVETQTVVNICPVKVRLTKHFVLSHCHCRNTIKHCVKPNKVVYHTISQQIRMENIITEEYFKCYLFSKNVSRPNRTFAVRSLLQRPQIKSVTPFTQTSLFAYYNEDWPYMYMCFHSIDKFSDF